MGAALRLYPQETALMIVARMHPADREDVREATAALWGVRRDQPANRLIAEALEDIGWQTS